MQIGKYLFIAGLFILNAFSAIGQATTNNPYFVPMVFPNAPNSASLGKFGNYQVSYFSGLPTISIPLYEINAGDINVPITLDYHPSGVKITEAASWVGLGWGLNTGGQIGRKVVGADADEAGNGYLQGNMRNAANIDPATSNGQSYLNGLISGAKDVEPDIFSYSFGGKSGNFFLSDSNNYQPVFIPFSPARIKSTFTPGNLTFNALDEEGNAYNFGVNNEHTTTSTGGVDKPVTSAWMLDNIIAADKQDTVSYSYNYQSGTTLSDVQESWVVDDNVTSQGSGFLDNFQYSANQQANVTSSSISVYTSEACPKEIRYKNGKVVFDFDGIQRQDITTYSGLADIKVYGYDYSSSQYQLLKTIVFYKSYFIQGTDAASKRLRLDSLLILSATGELVERYAFSYNPLMLPKPSSKARDYWGYYNGKANDMLVPQQQIDYTSGVNTGTSTTIQIGSVVANSREVDSSYNQACMLTRIYYPEGGFTDFKFESNRYTDNNNNVLLAGGQRIASIASYSKPGVLSLLKTYQYENARANFHLTDYYFSRTEGYRYWKIGGGGGGTTAATTKRSRTFLSMPSIDLVPMDATIVVYPKVTEYFGDSVNNAGKNVYIYWDFPDALSAPSVKPIVESHFFQRSMLKSKLTYRNLGPGGYRLKHEEDYIYAAFPLKFHYDVALAVYKKVTDEGAGSSNELVDCKNNISFGNYSILSDDMNLKSKVIVDYDETDPIKSLSDTTTYVYGNIIHQQQTKITSKDSKGYTRITQKKYPADYLSGTSTGNNVLDTMLYYNMQVPAIESWDSLVTGTGTAGVKGGVLHVFRQTAPGIIKPDNIKRLDLNAVITNFSPSSVSAGALQFDSRYSQLIKFDAYDSRANIAQYTIRNASPVSVIWDYSGSLAVAQVDNALLNDVAYTSFEGDGTGGWTIGSTNRTSVSAITGSNAYLLNSDISKSSLQSASSYKISYWTQNATAFTIAGTAAGYPVKGITVNGWTYYEHKVTGVTSVALSGSGNIDELRLYPASAIMKSYTYRPMIGVSSESDATGKVSYYEFDNAQRLRIMKDLNGNILKTFQYNYVNH